MSECGCKITAEKIGEKIMYDFDADDPEPVCRSESVPVHATVIDRSVCKLHSDAALAAKESQHQANMEDLRQQRDNEVANCAKQLQAMFDREQLATKSAESMSCMVEQLKVEAGYRIIDSARLREEIVVQRRDGIAKDERIRELEAELAILHERQEPHECGSCGKPCDCPPDHTGDEAWCQCPESVEG